MLPVVAAITSLVLFTVTIHMEGLWLIQRWTDHSRFSPRILLGLTVLQTLALHVVEIACYGAAFLVADRFMHVGALQSAKLINVLGYFYFSAETFTAVGYGDIIVTGDLRMIASIEPLNGLTLISWSGAFTFLAMQRHWDKRGGKPE